MFVTCKAADVEMLQAKSLKGGNVLPVNHCDIHLAPHRKTAAFEAFFPPQISKKKKLVAQIILKLTSACHEKPKFKAALMITISGQRIRSNRQIKQMWQRTHLVKVPIYCLSAPH